MGISSIKPKILTLYVDSGNMHIDLFRWNYIFSFNFMF